MCLLVAWHRSYVILRRSGDTIWNSYMVGTCRVNGLNNIILLNCRYHTGAYTMHLDLTCSNIFQYAIQHSSGEIGIWAILWSHKIHMMTSWNANIFHVTGPLWGEITVHRRIPLSKTNVAELWCFLLSGLEQTVEQTIDDRDLRRHRVTVMTTDRPLPGELSRVL